MRSIKKTALYFILTAAVVINSEKGPKTDFGSDENEVETIENIPHSSLTRENHKAGRILWPYPIGWKNGTQDTNGHKKNENKSRKKRLLFSYPQSPVVDIMTQMTGHQYSITKENDPFEFLRDSYPLPKGYSAPLDEYDYVIVGGGTAGSVLAARLSEDKPKAMVLVLEAGKPEMLFSDIPMMMPYLQFTDYVWPYTMEKQEGVCLGSENQRCFMPRGRALGGSSVTNNMLYSRGRPQEWDRIAADGNYGWSYNEVLQYYLKSEKAELKRIKNSPHHSRDGELVVENVSFRTGLVEAYLKAGKILGYPTVDYNAPDGFGFGYAQTTIHKGHRVSSARAFLHSHKRRKNLHIVSDATVTKILIEPTTKRAYGVEYVTRGISHKVRTRREVILSAGPIASPQLLMLSGVGPKEHLESLGIPVIQNLAVGKHLYDHISFPGIIFKLDTTNASLLAPKVETLENVIQWVQFGEGLLTSPGTVEGIGYIKTSISEDPQPVPDVELLSLGTSITLDTGGAYRKSWRFTDDTPFKDLYGADTWSALPVLLHPKSKGCLELRDRNPFAHPKIFGNYFNDSRDMATMLESIKFVIKLSESEMFKKYNPKLYLGQYHACRTEIPGSNSYWECAVRTLVKSENHQIATCRMGPPSDSNAVVDPELRVYGVDGLRVVGSSIVPRTVGGHSNALDIMIGEKAADMIKKTWSNIVS